ncbi:hypothetical protein LC147_27555, partial [Vibrio harveyi]|uniref:hypothetical protein n=1 Tax=Vibrio harveyi group TaxID=717610 RepID=UPI0015DC2FE7|nr:hypothetical protein DR996_16740 [Vibrio owensii]
MIRKNKIKEKLARKLKKKLSKKQRTNKVKSTDRFQKIIVPVIEHVTPYKLETFKSYYARWPKKLRNIPKNVVKQWAYEHNDNFLELWAPMRPEKWSFRRKKLSTSQCCEVSHLPKEIEHYEYVGSRYIKHEHERDYVANYMLSKGTFPQPIIITRGSSSLLHPKVASYGEHMTDNQLIEGHRRWGLLRVMSSSDLKVKAKHKVWLMRFNT